MDYSNEQKFKNRNFVSCLCTFLHNCDQLIQNSVINMLSSVRGGMEPLSRRGFSRVVFFFFSFNNRVRRVHNNENDVQEKQNDNSVASMSS